MCCDNVVLKAVCNRHLGPTSLYHVRISLAY